MKNRLKVLRAERDWSQGDLADRLSAAGHELVTTSDTGEQLDRELADAEVLITTPSSVATPISAITPISTARRCSAGVRVRATVRGLAPSVSVTGSAPTVP